MCMLSNVGSVLQFLSVFSYLLLQEVAVMYAMIA